jgi:hypothetical protein
MVKTRWETVSAEPGEVAVCYELAPGKDGFHEALNAQQAITLALRQTCGPRAEQVAVFAVSEREGERVEDYAREWGATVVCA